MAVDILVKVGRRIRYQRTARGISQEVLSARAGLSQANLSRIENGKAEPGLRTLADIAHVLNMKLSELLQAVD
jgi:transcriptional regulator with XRE-family HTH domain